MFDTHRNDERISFTTNGFLDIKGLKYSCLVDNISTTGVLIEINATDQEYIRLGDIGTLNVMLLSPVNYLCRVVRIESNQIGLQFLDMHKD